jgi:hypothetical protein
VAACGSGRPAASTYHPLEPPSRTQRPTRPSRPQFSIGAKQRIHTSGTTLSVIVRALLDPLRHSGAALLPHTRAVGVVAEIRDDGPAEYDSSSTGDFAVVPSSGAARPVFAPAGACQTPLRDWDNAISPGEVRTGCVAFAVPTGARIVAVRFSPHASSSGRATWLASR